MWKCVLTVLTTCVFALTLQAGDGNKKRDKKGDGKKPDPESIFKKLDTDSDGKLSKEEFVKFGENAKAAKDIDRDKMFDKLDSNSDGSLSLEEFKQLREMMKGKDKKREKKTDE